MFPRTTFSMIAIAVTLPALAQVPRQAKPVDPAKLRAKLLQAAYIEGKLTQIDEGESRFTFQYTHQVKTPHPKGQAKLADLSRRFNAALAQRSTSVDLLRNLQKQGRAALKEAYIVDETPVIFELKGGKTLAIRRQQPPVGTNGKRRALTREEQKEMQRNSRIPGYPAAFQDINAEVRVRVYLDRNKLRTAAKDGEQAVLPLDGILIVPEPKEKDPFVIPGE